MAVPRLKSPQDQARREDVKAKAKGPKSFASPHVHTEPAELVYGTWVKAHGAGNTLRFKRWHELSTYDRQAWRVVMSEMITAAGKIPVPIPQEDHVALGIHEGTIYISHEIAISECKSPALKKLLSEMRAELNRISEEVSNSQDGKDGQDDKSSG